ncbi:DNA replication initiation control protein YabA [Vagococcus acidifermentans]|uniref:Replication initiation control protein YabA n=1 Tax=Vagococcus acidifermentans TaxID=564710 RepID=A0A430B0Y1_9ENTE|nr:DNA replication initiation control protein YabA [Vagococcus acidifermentans]RSU13872.1 DNA replication initiation control protein YabA [Vagococcus acidifermentans]
MEKRTLYDELQKFEQELQAILAQVGDMKTAIHSLVEENLNLELENKHLREHLIQLEKTQGSSDGKQELSKSRLNLEKLYEEGFHVCNILYGSRRENNEECAFCLDVIYGERGK